MIAHIDTHEKKKKTPPFSEILTNNKKQMFKAGKRERTELSSSLGKAKQG